MKETNHMRNCFLVLLLACLACQKGKSEDAAPGSSEPTAAATGSTTDNWLQARVVFTNVMGCNRPVLDFMQDSVAIRAITGRPSLYCFVLNFPAQLNIANEQVLVKARKPNPGEMIICTANGPGFPLVFITDSRRP